MDKFKNKYRIATARARFWDYGWNAAYFVTICSKNRKCWFGGISNGVMNLSAMGHIANSCWYEIPRHFPFVELGAHVVMPNHVHGIVVINKSNDSGNDGGNDRRNDDHNDGCNVETQNFASLPLDSSLDSNEPSLEPSQMDKTKNKFGPQSKNLASIIRGFKIGVTRNARKINSNFAWQTRYHDHIIRDDQSYRRITEYINNNPAKW